jgi:hypothetical protein
MNKGQLQKYYWQARRDSNPQHPVLETGALPIELLAYRIHLKTRQQQSRDFKEVSTLHQRSLLVTQ